MNNDDPSFIKNPAALQDDLANGIEPKAVATFCSVCCDQIDQSDWTCPSCGATITDMVKEKIKTTRWSVDFKGHKVFGNDKEDLLYNLVDLAAHLGCDFMNPEVRKTISNSAANAVRE